MVKIALGAGALAAAMACQPAAAQSSAPGSDPSAIPANAWQFEFVPYLWLAGVSSDIRLGPLRTRTTNVSATGLLQALDFAAMGTLEAHKGDWGGFLDMQYIRLGVSDQFAAGLLGSFNVRFEEQIYTLAGTYRVYNGPVQVELLGGARYVNDNTKVTSDPSLLGTGFLTQETVAWWNGIVGIRAVAPITDKWSLTGYLDAGDGSGSSSWQAVAGASYQYSPTTSLKFGYRYLSFKRDDPTELVNKMSMGGIFLGAGFKF
jgi:opacity protein-like surface antigen